MKQTNKQRSMKDYFGLVLRGIAMGSADVVPGVSGGTMAFILGIYEELIESIKDIGSPKVIQALLRLRIKELLELVNWQFLVAVGSGIFIAIFSLARILEFLLIEYPVYLWSFFFGLIVASTVVVSKRIKIWSPPLYMMLLLGAVGAFLLVGLVPAQTPNSWWFLILSGAIAICGMILPGISGAFILVLLGKYQYVLTAVKDFDIATIAFVGIGAVIGIVSIAQLLGWLFNKYHDLTIAILIGLMVGSLRKVWPWKVDIGWLMDNGGQFVLDSHGEKVVTAEQLILPTVAEHGINQIGGALFLAIIGFGAILLMDRVAAEKPEH